MITNNKDKVALNTRKKLDNPIRSLIMQMIEESEICMSLDSFTTEITLTKGAIQQHLYFLEKIGMIGHFKIGKNFYYYNKSKILTETEKQDLIAHTIRFYGIAK